MTRSLASALLIDKGNYRHFMAKEIHEQPEVIGHTLAAYVDLATSRVDIPALPFDFANLTRLSLSACGTAFYACLVAKYWFERWARLPVDVDIASEFRYRETALDPGGAALFVSQSGETADTLATLRYCRAQAQKILSIVNVRESSIARESDAVLPTLAGPEIGVASTKAFTCQLTVLACLAIAAGKARGVIGPALEAELVQALGEVPRHMATILRDERPYELLAHHLSKARDVLYLGRGSSYPDRAGRRAQAQGDFLYPRRRLCRRRTEARADRADRREDAGHRHRPARRPLRKDRLQHAGGRGARRADRAGERRRSRRAPAAPSPGTCRCLPCTAS